MLALISNQFLNLGMIISIQNLSDATIFGRDGLTINYDVSFSG